MSREFTNPRRLRFFTFFLAALLMIMLTGCFGETSSPETSSGSTDSGQQATSAPQQAVFATSTPATLGVTVEDQDISGGTVTVARADSDRVGWLLIRADKDGAPGDVLGYVAVQPGANENLVVEIDTSGATETLYAALHMDAGTPGKLEYPGGYDLAMKKGTEPIMSSFQVTGGLP